MTTSCHLLTPAGAGGIALIRVAGPDAERIVSSLFRPKCGRPSDFTLHRVCFGEIADGGEVLDEVTACRSTVAGLPAIDICAHGGVRVLERILGALESAGAQFESRPAGYWPAKNKIEAEALAAMPDARTERAAAFLAFQRTHLPPRLVEIAAGCWNDAAGAQAALQQLMQGYTTARSLLAGWRVALLGPPNSGKSTLFNRLIGRPAAVVSPVAGTTRDWISADLEFNGIPLTLLDTPGRHDTPDALEREALRVAEQVARNIDAAILVLDSTAPLPPNITELIQALRRVPRSVVAMNKCDLPDRLDAVERLMSAHEQVAAMLRISAMSGLGCAELLRRLTLEVELQSAAPAFFTAGQLEISRKVLEYLASGNFALVAETIHHQLIQPAQDDCD